MFNFVEKYGHKIAAVAHGLADIVEADGPELVAALRFVGGFVPGAGPVVGAVVGAVEAVDRAIEHTRPAASELERAISEAVVPPVSGPAAAVPPPNAGAGWRNPLRG